MIAMLVLGGEGTLVGGLLGAATITLLPTIFQPLAAFKILAEGAILVLVFQYLPQGIWGSLVAGLSRVPALATHVPPLANGHNR
jgi:branched-chain amino acid transport system permease protein